MHQAAEPRFIFDIPLTSDVLAAYLPCTESIDDYPPIPEAIIDRDGGTIDTTGPCWRLNDAFDKNSTINWALLPFKNPWLIYCTMFLIGNALKKHSGGQASGIMEDLRYIRHHYSGELDSLSTSELEEALPAYMDRYYEWCKDRDRGYRFGRVRQWYCALADFGFPGFDPDEAMRFMEISVGGSPKGVAVLLHDPNEAALDPLELAELRSKLRLAVGDHNLLPGLTLVWLHLALGCNPKNLAQLCEQDFIVKPADKEGSQPLYFLMVPRIKKRGVSPRQEFKRRPLNPEIGSLVQKLIAQNKVRFPKLAKGVQRPIFFVAREGGRKFLSQSSQQFRFHASAGHLYSLFQATVGALRPWSHRTGAALHVTARRLRRTFATLAAATGMSPLLLAELLDHTDVQNVQVYYEMTGALVKKLDLTYAKELGLLADLFLGEIVPQALETAPPDKLIFGLPSMKIATIGRCSGKMSCTLDPPHACYPCAKFRAFRDADHEAVLQALIEERDERFGHSTKNAALDAQLSETILACARVCHLISSPPVQ